MPPPLFATGFAHGTLPREAFAGYVAQDKFFLDAFARAYAMPARSRTHHSTHSH